MMQFFFGVLMCLACWSVSFGLLNSLAEINPCIISHLVKAAFSIRTSNLCTSSWDQRVSLNSPLLPFSAFIKERKMGLNDFIQKLVSTPHICQQWVYSIWRQNKLSCGLNRHENETQETFWAFVRAFVVISEHASIEITGQSNLPPELCRTFCESLNLGPGSPG